MKFNIINYREGFATNSSSCHSVVKKADELIDSVKDCNPYGWEFGWGMFVLKSRDWKVKYLLTAMVQNVEGMVYNMADLTDDESKQQFIDSTVYELGKYLKLKCDNFCKIWKEFKEIRAENDCIVGYVDHQSRPTLLFDIFENKFDQKSWEYIVDTVLDDHTVIYGGSDNEFGEEEYNERIGFDAKAGDKYVNAHQDEDNLGYSYINEDGDHILVTFKLYNGERTTYNLTSDNTKQLKHKYPMVCDVKITDCCHVGCKFCYQNSTPSGKHASLSDIEYVADVLQKNKVFEVAIGGGDPLEHPQLSEIIDIFNQRGIITNITINPLCRKLHGKDCDIEEMFEAYSNMYKNFGIGVSRNILKAGALKQFYHLLYPVTDKGKYITLNNYKFYRSPPEVAVHLISGIDFDTNDQFLYKIRSCVENNVSPLLLGYKKIGRGVDYTGDGGRYNCKNPAAEIENLFKGVDEIYKEMSFYQKRFSVDTAFVNKYQKQLNEYGADKRSYHKTEGEQSFYIDVVNKQCSISSYDVKLLRNYNRKGKQSLENIIKDRYEIFGL